MITIEAPGASLNVRAAIDRVDRTLERSAEITPAGVVVVLGDGGWAPAVLRLSFRVASVVNSDAVPEITAVLAVIRSAHSVTDGERTVYVTPRDVQLRNRGTSWLVTASFLPRALDGVRGTGEVVTHLGEVVTYLGLPVTIEVT